MSSDIRVFVHQEDGADNIWAINMEINQDGTHTTWFGVHGKPLSSINTMMSTAEFLVKEKLINGYTTVRNLTIDTDSEELIHIDGRRVSSLDEFPEINPSLSPVGLHDALWYRISTGVPSRHIQMYLTNVSRSVSEFNPEERDRLLQLRTFNDLKSGIKSGGADYGEGPLALLLLFGLRRYLNNISNSNSGLRNMDLVSGADNFLTEKFSETADELRAFLIEMFDRNGWLSDRNPEFDWMDYVQRVARRHGMHHYTSIYHIKTLAVAMGCVDPSINLSELRSALASGYF
jgi:hypothetical protein